MLFQNNLLSVDYLSAKEIEKHLETKLQEHLKHEYKVYVRLWITGNSVAVDIDESTMTFESYVAYTQLKQEQRLENDLAIFSWLLKQQFGEEYDFKYLVHDLNGVYVIRENLSIEDEATLPQSNESDYSQSEKGLQKIRISRDTANAYFYAEGEEYEVVVGTAMAWQVASGEHQGRLIAHGHSRLIKTSTAT